MKYYFVFLLQSAMQHAARKDGPDSHCLGMRQPGSHCRIPEVKNQRGTKSGVDDDTRGLTTETGGASSITGDKRSQDSGKKHKSHTSGKAQGKFLNNRCDEIWELQQILKRKKASLGKTQQSLGLETGETEKALDTLAIPVCEIRKGQQKPCLTRSLRRCRTPWKNKEAQRLVEIASQTVHDRRGDHHTLFWDNENVLNEGSCCLCTGWRYGHGDEWTVLWSERQGQQ